MVNNNKSEKPSTIEKVGSAFGKTLSSAGPVIVVVAIGGVAIYLIYNWLTSTTSAAIGATQDTIKTVMDDYMTEYNQFASDGVIDNNERDVLNTKLKLIEPAVTNLSNAVPNINGWVGQLVTDAVIAGVSLYAITHLGQIGKNVQSLIDSLRGKSANGHFENPDYTEAVDVTFETPEEIASLFDFASICQIADEGSVSLASTLLSATQANYQTYLWPSMQNSYNFVAAQIALGNLTVGELAFANLELATYNAYLTYYVSLAEFPPLFQMMPPL